MCVDACKDLCTDICVEDYIELCVDTCIGMCTGMCIGMSYEERTLSLTSQRLRSTDSSSSHVDATRHTPRLPM